MEKLFETVFAVLARGAPPEDHGAIEELAMINEVIERRFTQDWQDRHKALAAYVRTTIAAVPRLPPDGSWNGIPVTDGDRCAPR